MKLSMRVELISSDYKSDVLPLKLQKLILMNHFFNFLVSPQRESNPYLKFRRLECYPFAPYELYKLYLQFVF